MADKTPTPEEVVGHADGDILVTSSEVDGKVVTEESKVVYDYDDDKNFIGWHKEPVKASK